MRARALALITALAGCGGGALGSGDGGPDAAVIAADATVVPPDAADAATPQEARPMQLPVFDGAPGPDLGPPDPCGPSAAFLTSKTPLIDAFPTAGAILVVRQDALQLVARDGTIMKTVASPRPITTAQFDGQRLLVADRAMLLAYSADLAEQGNVLLKEACTASALVDGKFVCGPSNDWDRVFYTFDTSPRFLARSMGAYTYEGLGLTAIPGQPYFLTSSMALFKVAPSGETTSVSRSYASSGPQGPRVAFVGAPASHLVTSSGQMFRIFGNGCDGMTNAFERGCFVRDGDLGTGKTFLALTGDAAGTQLFGLSGAGSSDAPCAAGCTLHQVDVAARKVVSEKRHLLDLGPLVSVRHDATCSRVVVVYARAGARIPTYPSDPPPEYQAASLAY